MGFKDEAREAFANLVTRVEALETLARTLRAQGGSTAVSETYNRPQAPVTGGTTGVDYAAVAFGLSEIKRKVAQLAGGHDLATEYAGTVQYFADVFAKADPSFDADAFRSQAGV